MVPLPSCCLFCRGSLKRDAKIYGVPSLLAAGLVGVLALASAAGSPLLAAAVLVVQGVFTMGAVRQAGVPGTVTAAWLALGLGAGASVWLVAEDIPDLTPMAKLLAAGFLLAIVAQLWRRHGRPMLTTSLALAAAAIVLAMLPASLVALRTADGGAYAVGFGLLGVGAAMLVDGAGRRSVLARTLSVLAAGAAAVGVAMLANLSDVPEVAAVVIAAFGALMAVAALYAVDRLADEPSVSAVDGDPAVPAGDVLEKVAVEVRAPLRISLPIVVAAPVIYILGRLLIG